jgi:2-succinyl-5-enolpyruvyl-6-hydroxy-3-cyclohexene-1-carboxylate synthase
MGKQHISRLAAIMAAKGISQVVVSPGSRNAPVIILFGANKNLQMLSVADERSAGFFALGLAMQSGKPVALLCTSGSAVLNYAPAVAEAYYQRIPLLVITADRPIELIDQGDSQTIRQHNAYANYIRKSFNLPLNVDSPNENWYFDRLVNEAIDRTQYPAPGPVQLNLPLDEPLYDLEPVNAGADVKIISYLQGETHLDATALEALADQWDKAASKLIIAGQMSPGSHTHELLKTLAKDQTVVVMTESISNHTDDDFINCIDRTLAQIPVDKNLEFTPDILLTLGGAIVSKKVKAMLRYMQPANHWHIDTDPESFHYDTYKSLTLTLALKPEIFLDQLLRKTNEGIPTLSDIKATGQSYSGENKETLNAANNAGQKDTSLHGKTGYAGKWKQASVTSAVRHKEFLATVAFSDLKVYEHIFNHLPPSAVVHLGNSTPVRYGQLFDQKPDVAFYSNRGTSGIDGCSSTAAGFAFNHTGLTVVITGDIGFFYDSNALWNNNLPDTFRVILINNGGGNIFRIIDGPMGYDALEPFIETRHSLEASGIAANFNISYYRAGNEEELKQQLPQFLAPQASNRPALLEIVTNNEVSAQTLKDYFEYLRKGKE